MANLADNSKARFDYEILDSLECGIELLGMEVKSVRKGSASLAGSRALIRGSEMYVVGINIPPYQTNNTPDEYDPMRTRRLLLKKSELIKLEKQLQTKGIALIPISLYTKGPKIKVQIAIARGKKKRDKRETIKKRDTDREIRRTLKNR